MTIQIQINFTPENFAQWPDEVNEKIRRAMRKGLRLTSEAFSKGMEDKFVAEGPGWSPLTESTLERKRSGGWPEDPLIRTGEMSNSIESWKIRTSKDGTGTATLQMPEYSAFHIPQPRGGNAPTRFMPGRDFIPEDTTLEEMAETAFEVAFQSELTS